MPRNGSGVYSPPGANYPAISGTLITAANRNAVDADIATALTGSIAVNGESVVTANIPFAGNKLTGIGVATARTDAASIATIQDGTGVYVGTVGGTADVITLTPSPAIASYVAGQLFSFVASGANTTNVTVNVSGLGAKAITKNGTSALIAADIPSGFLVTIRYDGTRFQLVGAKDSAFNGGTLTGDITMSGSSIIEAEGAAVASASSTGIWATDGNARHITGNTTINDFGTAPQAGARMRLIFDGTPLLTHSANLNLNNDSSNIQIEAGDYADVLADTTTQHDVIVTRKSGHPIKAPTGTYLGTVYYTCVSQALTSISNASPAVFTSSTSRLTPQNFAPIQLTTSGTLPTGLSLATTYYVFNASGSTFNVATSMANAIAGTAVNTSGAGSGTHTAASAPYVKATGVFGVPSFIEVDFIGGGAGSGGCTTTGGAASGGGGMGGRAKRRFNASQLGASETIVIGDGGAGGANTGGTGTNGSNTTFGALITCNGGTASIGATANATRAGGAGGTATGGDINITGMGGGPVISTQGSAGAGGFNELGNNGVLPASQVTYLPPDSPKNTGLGANGAQGSGTAQVGGQGASGIGIIREYS